MKYQTPKPMPKNQLKNDIARYEKIYRNPTNTLSQFFGEHVRDAWDLGQLSPADLVILKANLEESHSSSLIVLHLKRH